MAIEIGPIAKPHIWLEGALIKGIDSSSIVDLQTSRRVDHAKHLNSVSTTSIDGVTALNQEDFLTFNSKVRIVISGQVGNKFNYVSKNNRLSEKEFEGNTFGNSTVLLNEYAETWFTINGKDPVRGKSYLYKYLDTDDLGENDDWTGLGFILGGCQTGSDLITLKAKTYYKGLESRVAVAKFKIARYLKSPSELSLSIENAVPPE